MKKCEDVEAAEREKAFFECDVSDPEAEVSWLRDGKVRLLFHHISEKFSIKIPSFPYI